ncbi:hypothetical protein TcYC6_0054090 [Trypanosoma cruzi]|uniref:Uncharacterized protein n=1 Tax=Trypanosoma cruzi (strain CL Brener) TaxID=353153 RepID=Q4DF13_TRYCC|nr:hypothetical protein Tc00.1047053509163.6 [Trypanosoma cruzi]EAN91116.1 hypothetical protein Tc00.1047053509163.6 [Trypanosoma cruzi]KAF8301589.1 hypothetical protein TcYC6_0054090 [Trypanosoma cruzi]|eukprot:XP_812967.1 hypothetical protein [Trypanosoma cruzi strain CL Brener]
MFVCIPLSSFSPLFTAFCRNAPALPYSFFGGFRAERRRPGVAESRSRAFFFYYLIDLFNKCVFSQPVHASAWIKRGECHVFMVFDGPLIGRTLANAAVICGLFFGCWRRLFGKAARGEVVAASAWFNAFCAVWRKAFAGRLDSPPPGKVRKIWCEEPHFFGGSL